MSLGGSTCELQDFSFQTEPSKQNAKCQKRPNRSCFGDDEHTSELFVLEA